MVYYDIEMPDFSIDFTPHNSLVKISRAVNIISILKVRKLLLKDMESLAIVERTVNGKALSTMLGYFFLQAGRVERELGLLSGDLASVSSCSTSWLHNGRQTFKGFFSL